MSAVQTVVTPAKEIEADHRAGGPGLGGRARSQASVLAFASIREADGERQRTARHFINTTGDGVFDGTLKQALAVELEQSPYLKIFPVANS